MVALRACEPGGGGGVGCIILPLAAFDWECTEPCAAWAAAVRWEGLLLLLCEVPWKGGLRTVIGRGLWRMLYSLVIIGLSEGPERCMGEI